MENASHRRILTVLFYTQEKKMYFRDTANKGINGKSKSQVNDHV